MFKAVVFQQEKKYKEDFLLLPKLLYDKKHCMQSESVEQEIIEERHVLNKYFKQYKIIVYENESMQKPTGRCIVTIYHHSKTAYIGYYECINDPLCAKVIFDKAKECVNGEGLHQIEGPVDSSFWIKYRLKLDLFDKRPYTCEPYNLAYYKEQFDQNGYQMTYKYSSKLYGKVGQLQLESGIYKERWQLAIEKGYEIKSPSPKAFVETMQIIYELISKLFADFPMYEPITEDEFMEIYKSFKPALDYEMIKIIYYRGKPVAFSLGVPNYYNDVYGKLNLMKIASIMKKKIHSKEYVFLYMGVLPEHKGLGRVLVQEMIEFAAKKKSSSIGALQLKGKKTNEYVKELIDDLYHYAMFKNEW